MRRRLTLGLLCLALAACARKADVIVSGGMVWTGLAIGDDSAVGRYAGPKTQWIQAKDGLVLPGFTDGHTHFIDGGFQLASVSLRDAATPQELIRRVREY